MTAKRVPTLKQQKLAFKELGKLLEDLRIRGDCSQGLIEKLEEFKEVWGKDLFKLWVSSR